MFVTCTQPRASRIRRSRFGRGTVLIVAVVLLVFLTGLTASMVTLASNDRVISRHRLSTIGVDNAAEGACIFAQQAIMTQLTALQGNVPLGQYKIQVNGITVFYTITQATFAASANCISPYTSFTIQDSSGFIQSVYAFEITATAMMWPNTGMAAAQDASYWTAFSALTSPYTPTATMLAIRASALATSVTHRSIAVAVVPTFQYAIFYNVDCEIDPGVNMTLSGRVQSNASMYLSPAATTTFQTNWVHAAGSFYRTRGDGVYQGGSVNVAINGNVATAGSPPIYNTQSWVTNGTGTLDTSSAAGGYNNGATSFSAWSTSQFAAAGNTPTVLDGSMGATVQQIPNFSSTAPGAAYETEAKQGGLDITMDAAGVLHAYANNSATDIIGSLPPGAVQTGTFWNQRAGAFVTVVDIDVGVLRTSSLYPTAGSGNGVLYVKNYKAGAGSANGVRLKDGQDLVGTNVSSPDNGKGLMVVSQDPVYIKGDWNNPSVAAGSNFSGNGGSSNAYSMSAPPADYRSSGILADSLSLQSNSWSDAASATNRTGGGAGTAASDTTYNVAFVAGNSASAAGAYGGGVENFVRFMEDWSSKNCNINGSINCFQHAAEDTSNFVNGAPVYKAPIRNWAFDQNLLHRTPPAAPNSATLLQGVCWQQR